MSNGTWTEAAMIEIPMFVRCTERESSGYHCEAMLTTPDEKHKHFISDRTINEVL